MSTKKKINVLEKFNSAVDGINKAATIVSEAAKKVEVAAVNVGITKENIEKTAAVVGHVAASTGKVAGKAVVDSSKFVGEKSVEAYGVISNKIKETDWSQYEIEPETIIKQVIKIPGMRVDRSQFLKKELIKYFPKEVVEKAVDKNPAFAGIEREKINEIATEVINFETNKVSALSFAAGLPGGFTVAATIPADIAQYFGHIALVLQKLAYLYGFDELQLNETDISDDTLNELMIFMGVMFGVQGANKGVLAIAELATAKVAKSLAAKALTKTAYYPIVKSVATKLGASMTKAVFAKGVSKLVPIAGGLVSGGLTYATFKPSCNKLKKSFMELRLSDPDSYVDIIDTDIEEVRILN